MKSNHHTNESKTVRFRELSKRRSLPILASARVQPVNTKFLQPSSQPTHKCQDIKQVSKTTSCEQARKVLSRQNSWPLSSRPAFAPIFQLNKEVLRKYTHSYNSENYVYKRRYFTMQDQKPKGFKSRLLLPRLTEVPDSSHRSYCDSLTRSLQCSSLASQNSTRHPLFEKDGRANRPLKNEHKHVAQWLKAINKKYVKVK